MSKSHLFSLSQVKPQKKREGGTRTEATKSNFPLLKGMSFYKLALFPKGIREPHWHANADEFGYCIQGTVLVSLYGTGDQRETFLVKQGEMFLIPSGTLHAIENIGENTSELIFQFSHEEPEDFGLSSTLGMFSNAVLGNTWGVKSDTFSSFKRPKEEVFIALNQEMPKIPDYANYSSKFHYNLEGESPLISNEGGQVKVARKDVWPALRQQSLYSLILTGVGMREPHWHPETAEMGYVHQGKGRMSILSPDGSIDTYEMNEGDLYFIPKAYPHHIENLTNDKLHLLIFFDQPMPEDIGLTASVKSNFNDVLTSVFNTPIFETLPKYYKDLFIVTKVNPLDK